MLLGCMHVSIAVSVHATPHCAIGCVPGVIIVLHNFNRLRTSGMHLNFFQQPIRYPILSRTLRGSDHLACNFAYKSWSRRSGMLDCNKF